MGEVLLQTTEVSQKREKSCEVFSPLELGDFSFRVGTSLALKEISSTPLSKRRSGLEKHRQTTGNEQLNQNPTRNFKHWVLFLEPHSHSAVRVENSN